MDEYTISKLQPFCYEYYPTRSPFDRLPRHHKLDDMYNCLLIDTSYNEYSHFIIMWWPIKSFVKFGLLNQLPN